MAWASPRSLVSQFICIERQHHAHAPASSPSTKSEAHIHPANLSLSFARLGLRTGILDTDIFGPSIPTLFNLTSYSTSTTPPRTTDSGLLIPLTNYGVATMSMGYLLPSEGAPVVWRGMMVMKALQQLLHSVAWDNLDVLVLDMPPGTGDTQLTISQQIELDGAVVVSTPQDLALKDAIKGLEMFKKVDVRVLGMVQNMSVFCCPNCGHETHIFGEDGVRRRCGDMGLELLGNVPLDARICEDADRGKPTVVAEPGGKRAEAYEGIARRVAGLVGFEVR